MNQWRSKTDQIEDLEQQVKKLSSELEQTKDSYQALQLKHQTLKTQNDRLLKMEAQHQSAKTSLMQKRIVFSRAVILIPESMVIGDRLENSVLKIYRGSNLTITDTAELINCRIVGLSEYADEKTGRITRPMGTIEIKGLFRNTNPRKFAISTYERVVISRGARFTGNICAESIIISELTRVRGRLATRELWERKREQRKGLRLHSNVLEINVQKSR